MQVSAVECSFRRGIGHAVTSIASKTWDMLRLIGRGGPALCNIAVTNSCNAACDFCNFSRGKVAARDLRWIDTDKFGRALDILHKRGIRYVSFLVGRLSYTRALPR